MARMAEASRSRARPQQHRHPRRDRDPQRLSGGIIAQFLSPLASGRSLTHRLLVWPPSAAGPPRSFLARQSRRAPRLWLAGAPCSSVQAAPRPLPRGPLAHISQCGTISGTIRSACTSSGSGAVPGVRRPEHRAVGQPVAPRRRSGAVRPGASPQAQTRASHPAGRLIRSRRSAPYPVSSDDPQLRAECRLITTWSGSIPSHSSATGASRPVIAATSAGRTCSPSDQSCATACAAATCPVQPDLESVPQREQRQDVVAACWALSRSSCACRCQAPPGPSSARLAG